jgi:hypothetical protein
VVLKTLVIASVAKESNEYVSRAGERFQIDISNKIKIKEKNTIEIYKQKFEIYG